MLDQFFSVLQAAVPAKSKKGIMKKKKMKQNSSAGLGKWPQIIRLVYPFISSYTILVLSEIFLE